MLDDVWRDVGNLIADACLAIDLMKWWSFPHQEMVES